MRVLLPAVSASRKPEGVSRHAANLVRCLLLSPEIERVDLIVGRWQEEAMKSMLTIEDVRLRVSIADTSQTAIGRNRWYWQRLPKLAHELGSDIVHATYPVPLHRSAFGCPVVVTLHDFYPYDIPANFGYPKVFANRAIMRQCLVAADAVVCVSESTLRRLEMHAPQIASTKALTIYNCVEPAQDTTGEVPLKNWDGEPFLLCVAQHRRNKNLPLAIRVFRRLLDGGDVSSSARLVIVGSEGPESKNICYEIERAGLQGQVVLQDGISDSELGWCYTHCELLLASSVVEGFGLPVVEAMLRHCRIVCSDIPAFREVGGSYCYYADLHHRPEDAFVEATRRVLAIHRFRTADTARFSSARIAKECLKLYTQVRKSQMAGGSHSLIQQLPSFEKGQP